MKKTEIRVTIDSVEKQQRAIEILERYGEKIWDESFAMEFETPRTSLICCSDGDWFIQFNFSVRTFTEITLDELEKLLKAEK